MTHSLRILAPKPVGTDVQVTIDGKRIDCKSISIGMAAGEPHRVTIEFDAAAVDVAAVIQDLDVGARHTID